MKMDKTLSLNQMPLNFLDIHYHTNPDLYYRFYDALTAGQLYQKLQGAVVLKSHLGSTALQATMAQQQGLPVFPSLVLNKIAGGIHYRNIIRALTEYHPIIPSKLIVHFPTITGRKHESKLRRKKIQESLYAVASEPEVISEKGKLKPEVIDILKMANDYPIVLSSGHASKQEVYELIEACFQLNVSTLLLNQPANPLTGFSAEELTKIAHTTPFLWIEQTALTYLLGYQSLQDFIQVLCNVENVIYSSDLGQVSQLNVDQWVECSKQWFSDFKIPNKRKEAICLINPLKLLAV